MLDELTRQLKGDEGTRLRPYRDSVGKLTIGTGRNLDDVGISQGEADQMLWNDINMVTKMLKVNMPWVTQLSEARFGVLCNLCFNIGIERLEGFPRFLACLKDGKYEAAAIELENSKWRQQVGARADRLILQMRTDKWVFLGG